jgi:hypothetical protein
VLLPDQNALRAIVEQLDAAIAKKGRTASVRCIPAELWNEYFRLAPRCECGTPLAPAMALKRRRFADCSEKHRRRRERRQQAHARRLRRREAVAIADALFQAGSPA